MVASSFGLRVLRERRVCLLFELWLLVWELTKLEMVREEFMGCCDGY